MNKEMFYKVADRIENEVDGVGFDISKWYGQGSCGTTACVAGHAVYAEYGDTRELIRDRGPGWYDFVHAQTIRDRAQRLMGLTYEQGEELFAPWSSVNTIKGRSPAVVINDNAHLVPDALRWMADNQSLDWEEALDAAAEKCEAKNG